MSFFWKKRKKMTHIWAMFYVWAYVYVSAFAPFYQSWGGITVLVRSDSIGGVLYKSPGRSFLEAPLYSSRAPLEVDSAQLALAESNCMCWANWTWKQTCYLGAMFPQTSGRSTEKHGKYGESSTGQRLTSLTQKTTLIAKLIFWRTWMHWSTTGPTSSFMLFPQLPWSRR